MAETVTKETTVTENTPTTSAAPAAGTVEQPVKTEEPHTVSHLVYYVLGLVEILLAFRLVLKLLGANPSSGFVSGIYAVTGALVAPFNLIFRSASTRGVETTSVLEPQTIIAMIVYGILVWGIAKLVQVASGRAHQDK